MRIVLIIIFFSFISALNHSAHAQNDFAKLEKNVNIRAKGLIQQLNSTKDTLILNSKSLINKVYAVSEDYKREVDIVVNDKNVQIPLHNLSMGKHVFVAVQSPVRIVFVVKILRDDHHLLLAVDDDDLVAKNKKK
ncbi:hypothetical protein [Psychroserpens sp. MEBiC05023]